MLARRSRPSWSTALSMRPGSGQRKHAARPRGGVPAAGDVLFFQSGYGEVWNKLVAGLEWARQFPSAWRGMQPSPAAYPGAQRLGWQVMRGCCRRGRPLAGEEQYRVRGRDALVAITPVPDVPPSPNARSSLSATRCPGRSRRSAWSAGECGPGRAGGGAVAAATGKQLLPASCCPAQPAPAAATNFLSHACYGCAAAAARAVAREKRHRPPVLTSCPRTYLSRSRPAPPADAPHAHPETSPHRVRVI